MAGKAAWILLAGQEHPTTKVPQAVLEGGRDVSLPLHGGRDPFRPAAKPGEEADTPGGAGIGGALGAKGPSAT